MLRPYKIEMQPISYCLLPVINSWSSGVSRLLIVTNNQ